MNTKQFVLGVIEKYNMLTTHDSVLAAVSGGADSVCMLHILKSLKDQLGFRLGCAHVNHGLRGEMADRDEEFVRNLCKEWDIPFFCHRANILEFAREKGLTVEEAGRLVRYNFFGEVSKEYGFSKVATAHNKNDNAETVLMRIIRGTGVDGLSGIPHIRKDGVIRPILDLSRAEIEEYCKENSLEFCTDETNQDNDYTRNKIRNQLIPYIEKELNSGIIDSLLRLSQNAREDSKFINSYAERLYQRIGNPLPSGRPNALHIESLEMVDLSVKSRVIRLAAKKSSKDVTLEKGHMDDIFELMKKGTGSQIDLPKGLKAQVNYGWLTFMGPDDRTNSQCTSDDFFAQVSAGQTVFVDSISKNITFREEDARTYKCKLNEIAVDLDKVGSQPLFLRSRRNGDRMVWFQDGRTKKIKSIFIDEKISQKDRNRIPLLATGDEVVAIVGSRVSEKYKVTKDSERALVIEYGTIE